jgi:hypothetical protein
MDAVSRLPAHGIDPSIYNKEGGTKPIPAISVGREGERLSSNGLRRRDSGGVGEVHEEGVAG